MTPFSIGRCMIALCRLPTAIQIRAQARLLQHPLLARAGWALRLGPLCRLRSRGPRKAERLAAVEAALTEHDPHAEVFYVDEADVDLNPRIRSSWVRCGEQTTVPTPEQNQRNYIAGPTTSISLRSCATSSGSISTPPNTPWSSASMRNHKSKPSTAPNPGYR